MEEYQPLTSSDRNVQVISLNDDSTQLITVGFDYNWFGGAISVVCLSSNGQINMGNACDSSFNLKAIGSYNAARIAFVQEDIDPPMGGSIKYLIKSSPSSLKISFENLGNSIQEMDLSRLRRSSSLTAIFSFVMAKEIWQAMSSQPELKRKTLLILSQIHHSMPLESLLCGQQILAGDFRCLKSHDARREWNPVLLTHLSCALERCSSLMIQMIFFQ